MDMSKMHLSAGGKIRLYKPGVWSKTIYGESPYIVFGVVVETAVAK